MKEKKRQKVVTIDDDSEPEDWCFICKDGGELIICDDQDCLKVYHSNCVQKEGFRSEIGDGWTCDRHVCLNCHKPSKFKCLCCPSAVCKTCKHSVDFLLVKDDSGFCSDCLELVILGEEDDPRDSDGNMIDFIDRNTQEGLFKEYWDIIKKKECLTMDAIHSAIKKAKKKKRGKHCSVSGKLGKPQIEDEDEDDDYDYDNDDDDDDCVMIEDDEEETESKKPLRRKKLPEQDEEDTESSKPLGKRKKSEEIEFCGWASKPLIEFLKSIGKDTSKPIGLYDVDRIVKDYIRRENLGDPKKKHKISCDPKLFSVFKKTTLPKSNIYLLLEKHLVEESESQKEENSANDDNNDDENDTPVPVKHRARRSDESDTVLRPTGFASIVYDNIKLLYLRRSLVEELLEEPENFQRKVIGCFIRVKSDARDSLQRSSNQVLPIKAVEKSSTGEIFLKASSMSKGIRVHLLSDSDFTEDECQDLLEKMEKGDLEKPTVVELEDRARSMHEDVTRHWIKRELNLLQRRIDHANDKGRRQELNNYVEQRELLQEQSYQKKLLQKLPKVIPELVEAKSRGD